MAEGTDMLGTVTANDPVLVGEKDRFHTGDIDTRIYLSNLHMET